MLSSIAIGAVAAIQLVSSVSAAPALPQQQQLSRHVPLPSSDNVSPLVATSRYSELSRVKSSKSSGALSAARIKNYGSAHLRNLIGEEEWAVKVKIAGKETLLILDTGSSDTWVIQKGFQCVSDTLQPMNESQCAFGPVYSGTFESGKIKNENFNISYGDGEFLTGTLGYSDVTIAGITAKNQEISLVNKAYWNGDENTSGLIGVAYSALTSAFIGNDPTKDNWHKVGNATGDNTPYSPVVQTMIAQGLNPPLFSLALQRSKDKTINTPGGYIAFGGLPPVGFDPIFTSTPIEIYQFNGYPDLEATQRSFYTIMPDGYLAGNTTITKGLAKHPVIVDSGTTLNYIPPNVLSAYISSFAVPPQHRYGAYFLPCDTDTDPTTTEIPPFGVIIGGTTFNVSAADLLLPGTQYQDKKTGVDYCILGLDTAGSGANDFPVLGDVFLKNVIAVFDVGASLLRLAPHVY